MKNHIRKVLVIEAGDFITKKVLSELQVTDPIATVETFDLLSFTSRGVPQIDPLKLPSMILIHSAGDYQNISGTIHDFKSNALTGYVPVIILTGKIDEQIAEMLYQSKVNCQLTLPQTEEETGTIMKAILKLWLPRPTMV